MTTPDPTSDPLAIVDQVEQFADQLEAAVAVLIRRGWDEPQARVIVFGAVCKAFGVTR
jgi:hypothetical protein